MEPVSIYGIAAGGIFLLCFFYCVSHHISRWIQDRTLFYVFKYLIYPIVIQRTRLSKPFSRWHAIMIAIYWSGTVACNLVGINSFTQAGNRAGALAILNLVPLLSCNRPAFLADLLGISLHTYMRLHTSFGIMVFLQSLIHTIIFATRGHFNIKETMQLNGVLAAVAIASLMLLSIFQIPLYEFFQKIHYAIAILIVYAIWRHVSVRSSSSRIYMIVAACVFLSTTTLRYARVIWRNVVWSKPYPATQIIQVKDAVRLRITLPRPWQIRAGEFIYIWMPGVSFWSSFQSHPFMISWWDRNADGEGVNIYLLLKPRSGFTQRLLQHAGPKRLLTWVDGPYGRTHNVGDYGTVLMFATGIGIAAQVPYIKQLLKGFQEFRVRTKAILLIWRLDKESDQEWVQDWMTELLSEDKGAYILRIRLYVLGSFDDQNKSYGDEEQYGEHERIKKLYGKPDLEKIIDQEVAMRRGKMLITTSTEADVQDQIQKLTKSHVDTDLDLIHLAFQPREYQGLWSPKPPEAKYQGLV